MAQPEILPDEEEPLGDPLIACFQDTARIANAMHYSGNSYYRAQAYLLGEINDNFRGRRVMVKDLGMKAIKQLGRSDNPGLVAGLADEIPTEVTGIITGVDEIFDDTEQKLNKLRIENPSSNRFHKPGPSYAIEIIQPDTYEPMVEVIFVD